MHIAHAQPFIACCKCKSCKKRPIRKAILVFVASHTPHTKSIMFSPNEFHMNRNNISFLRLLLLSQIVNCSICNLKNSQFRTDPHRKIKITNKTSCDRSRCWSCYIISQNQLLSFLCFLCHLGGDGWSQFLYVKKLVEWCWLYHEIDYSSQVIVIRFGA